MKKFIIKNCIFFSLLGVFFLGNYNLNRYFQSKHPVSLPQVDFLFLGDSHFERGINPSLIAKSANIAVQAEPYIATFHKLKLLLRQNPQIKTVLLSLSFSNLSELNEVEFFDSDFAQYIFRRYYPVWSLDDLNELKFDRQIYYSIFMRNMLLFPKKHHFSDFLGGFTEDRKTVDETKDKANLLKHFVRKGKALEVSKLSKAYLFKIVGLFKKNEAQLENLIVIIPPLHPKYLSSIPQNHLDSFNQTVKKLRESGVSVWDERALYGEDALFVDYDHLNSAGARLFSLEISKRLHSAP